MPWRREWLPTPVFLPVEFHGQRTLAGYGPQGHKELDMTPSLHHFTKSTQRSHGLQGQKAKCCSASFKLARELRSPEKRGSSSLCFSVSTSAPAFIFPPFCLHLVLLFTLGFTLHFAVHPRLPPWPLSSRTQTQLKTRWSSLGRKGLAWLFWERTRATQVISEQMSGFRCVPSRVQSAMHFPTSTSLEVTLPCVIPCSSIIQRAVGGNGAKLPGWMLPHKERNYL